MAQRIDGYSYYISNDSDDEEDYINSSSDDDAGLPTEDNVNKFLHGTPQQQTRALQRITGENVSSSEDEFEEAMKKELDEKMRAVEESWIDDYNLPAEFPQSTNDAAKECTSGEPGTSEKFYNDVYFDSDEDTGDGAKVKKRVISDAELLYDPHADDKDQMWVDKQRTRGKIPVKKAGSPNKSKKVDNAQLSCPACLTTVCLDCQRHDLYDNQFRAMFVMNCEVLTEEVMHYKEPKKKVFKRHKRKADGTKTAADLGFERCENKVEDTSSNTYHPVKCQTCKTEIAYYDNDEVYHFFNVIAGPG